MSSDLAISVRGLSKAYVIRHNTERHDTLAATFLHRLRDPFYRSERETFWALKDVSFDVHAGEIVGIIGRNGAGKSTLLKIMSRITEPTSGEIDLYGRIGSLLEVGTGFHPELTGRENIYLNGQILGMRRKEIDRHFDAIIDFAGVEKFLDTPVKRYSSGMYIRLAFAVAAHLESDILVVDEVLAVGDSQFQKKCIGKMGEVAGAGRTVLFVSHNMAAVKKLCNTGIFLESGRVVACGEIGDVLDRYLSLGYTDSYLGIPSDRHPRVMSVKVLSENLRTDADLRILVEWVLPERTPGIKVGVGYNCSLGQRVFDWTPEDIGQCIPEAAGRYTAIFCVPKNTLMARQYLISVGLWNAQTVFDHANPALMVSIEAAPVGSYSHEGTREGLVHVNIEWTLLGQAT